MSIPYEDLGGIPEHERIVKIGNAAMQGGKVAFIVEDEAKADRYVRTLLSLFPQLQTVKNRGPIPRPISVIVTIRKGDGDEQPGK